MSRVEFKERNDMLKQMDGPTSLEAEKKLPVETVRAVLVNDKGEVLLLQKDETSKNPLKWELVGGKIDDPEARDSIDKQIEELKRETEEETRLTLDTATPFLHLGVFTYNFDYKGTNTPRKVHTFLIRLNSRPQITINASGDKHQDYRWTSLDRMRMMRTENKPGEEISPNSGMIIDFILQNPGLLQTAA